MPLQPLGFLLLVLLAVLPIWAMSEILGRRMSRYSHHTHDDVEYIVKWCRECGRTLYQPKG